MNCLNGSQYSFLSGSVYIDYDCDGIQDVQDFGVFEVEMHNFGQQIGYLTFPDGAYEIPLPINSEFSIAPENLPGVNLVSPHSVSTSDQSESFGGVDFGLCPIPNYYDLQVETTELQNWNSLYPWASGSQRNLSIKVHNQGPYFSGGQLVIEFPDAALQVIQDGGGTVTSGEIIVDIGPINPYGNDYTLLNFLLTEATPLYEMYNINIEVVLDSDLPQDQFPGNNEVILDFIVADTDGNAPFCNFAQQSAGFPADPACEQAICGLDSFCCSGVWDSICASLVLDEPACIDCISGGENIVIEGNVYIDLNCNEVYDAEDVSVPYANIFKNEGLATTTNSNGTYAFITPMWDDITVSSESFYGFQMNPVQLSALDSSVAGVDFALCPEGDVVNLGVYISQVSLPPRPGFDFEYEVCVQNFGNSATGGIVTFDFSGIPGIPLIDAGEGVVDGTEITFNVDEIGVFETVCFPVTFHVPQGTTVGTTLTVQATVETMSELIVDQTTHNNFHEFICEVVGAYDPNDKTVNKPVVNHTEIEPGEGVELEYVIRFQNTGNFFATIVRVEDQLPELLDINTIETIHASHDYELVIHPNNMVEWVFEDIMLPDSTTNEPESHGQIHFRITTVPGVQLEDVIENSASIFFDFKEPVITEPAVTTFIDCSEGSLSILSPENLCVGEEFLLTSNRDDFENYIWSIDGSDFQGEEIDLTFFDAGPVLVNLIATNAVCTLSTETDLQLMEPPYMNMILEPWLGCFGEVEIDLEPNGEVNWYLQDDLVASGNPVTLFSSGMYEVTVENECGMIENNVVAEVYDIPDEVTLTLDGEQLIVSPEGSDYVWLLNGFPVSADGPAFTPTESGDYTVIVYFEGSMCSQTSNIMYVPVSIEESLAAQIQLFPNPAGELSTLSLPQGQWQVSLIDSRGKIIQSFENVSATQFEIDLRNLSQGVYFVNVQSVEGTIVKKLVIE